MNRYFNASVEITQGRIQEFRDAFKGTAQDWQESEEARNLYRVAYAAEQELATWNRHSEQAKSLKHKAGGLSTDFENLWKSSSIGWGIEMRIRQCRDDDPEGFSDSVFRDYDAIHPSKVDRVWCPVTRAWRTRELIVASHIFPFKSTQSLMTGIFGTVGELMHHNNAIPMVRPIQDFFDLGLIALVPDFPNGGENPCDVEDWQLGRVVRQYKIRIFARPCQRMDNHRLEVGPYKDKSPWALDGQPVEFRNNHRPRAQYLYFHYLKCLSAYVVGNSDRQKQHQILYDEMRKPFWGTRGSYIRQGPLLGFAREFGQNLELLLDNYIPEAPDTLHSRELVTVLHAEVAATILPMTEEEEGEEMAEEKELAEMEKTLLRMKESGG